MSAGRLWLGLLAAAAFAVGCSEPAGDGASATTSTVERTRVQVVDGLGKEGSFDPASIYKQSSAGVVTVSSSFGGGVGPLGGGEQAGLGSGFVVDRTGHVLTNAHVVTAGESGRGERAKEVFVEFADGDRVPAQIVGDDPNSDVALLKVDPRGLSLRPLALGSSRHLAVGEPVAAIGSPLGERQTLTIGVISALDRDIESLTDYRIGNAIQTDAAINQGSSGGPLISSAGRVIGINSQIKSTSGGSIGLGFAVPADAVKRSLDQLRERGRVEYAFIGVAPRQLYPRLAKHLGVASETGALVADVVPGSPADDAGLQAGRERTSFQGERDIPRGGDVIVSLDGTRLSARDELADLIALRKPGARVRLEVLRGEDSREVSVELAARPAPDRGR